MQQHLVDKLQLLQWIRFSDVNNNKMDEDLCGRLEVQNGHFYPPAKLFHQGTELNPLPSYPAKTPTRATSLVSGFLLKKCQLSNPHTQMQRAAYCRIIQVILPCMALSPLGRENRFSLGHER
jgi:hypothetical protein